MFMEIFNIYAPAIAKLLAIAVFGSLGILLGRLLNTEVKQTIARNAMLFVEQTVKDLHGEEKMLEALKVAQQLLAKWKIKFDVKEMRILIEAALGAFNQGVNKGAGTQIVITEEAVADYEEALPAPLDGETAKGTYKIPECENAVG